MIMFSSQDGFVGSFFPPRNWFQEIHHLLVTLILGQVVSCFALGPADLPTFGMCFLRCPIPRKNHCGCGQKRSKTLMHMMKHVRTTWEVCWSLARHPSTSLEPQTAQSSGEVASMTKTVQMQLLFAGSTFLC